ncbi:sulfurtransferase [Pontixanthobacter sp.]|uniref:sulfurtransferase n=1 Tax=Pontixanthobacter sp. TaxID=2792078 RepID=UPI003C7BCB21
MNTLVSTDWLAQHCGGPGIIVLDASAHLPAAGRDPAAEFDQAHIPGARFLGLPSLTDTGSAVPSALPNAAQFAQRMQELGVTAADRVVLYDNSMLRSSARAYFIFTMFGFSNAAVLDGGLGKWTAEGRDLETGAAAVDGSQFHIPRSDHRRVRSKADMLDNIATGTEQVVDARDAGRFTADIEDAVHGLAGGHIPGARNLHFVQLLQDDGTFKDPAGLRAAFRAAGIDLAAPVTASCGSGMTASVVLFALELIGHERTALYDGSWSEWGADPETPKEAGPAA